jgi:hypothetical protein
MQSVFERRAAQLYGGSTVQLNFQSTCDVNDVYVCATLDVARSSSALVA